MNIIERLLNSTEPSIRYKILVDVFGEDKNSPKIKKLQSEIKNSYRVQMLLSERNAAGEIFCHPYRKWYGAHWVLSMLADLGYPPGDRTLIPLREQVYGWLFSEEHAESIKVINGRVRRCASQEGNAVYYLFALGLADARTEELAKRLMEWQWQDGGWNCDRNPEAVNSSFMETLLPLRGLVLFWKATKNSDVQRAVKSAAEIFLKREIYKIKPRKRWRKEDFLKLHYPCFWHYDILFGLKVMSEAGFIRDKRCKDALNILHSKQLPDGGFPAEGKFYSTSKKIVSRRSPVDWGWVSKKRLNEFITADAIYVLTKAGYLKYNDY